MLSMQKKLALILRKACFQDWSFTRTWELWFLKSLLHSLVRMAHCAYLNHYTNNMFHVENLLSFWDSGNLARTRQRCLCGKTLRNSLATEFPVSSLVENTSRVFPLFGAERIKWVTAIQLLEDSCNPMLGFMHPFPWVIFPCIRILK